MRRFVMVFAVLVLVAAIASAQDPAKVAPQQCKVALENDYVRVLHWTVAPHEKSAMHEHPALVSVSLSGGKTRFTLPDGKSRDVESKAGQATWSDPDRHSSEDMDDKTGEIIQVELKKRPGAGMVGIPRTEDAVAVDAKHYNVEFQNDRVRVLRIQYGPGEKSLMHAHPASVAIYLTDGRIKMTLPDGKTRIAPAKAGQVQWTAKEEHLPENNSGTPFELVLVELR